MSLCGIIAEYNPFHNGHQLHVNAARALGCDGVAVMMSGSFVQRGEVALHDKWRRARWALLSGADLIFELPTVYSLQSAASFASGGVRALAAAGADALCFGSETPDAGLIRKTALLLNGGQPDQDVQAALAAGHSYPRARYEALRKQDPTAAEACLQPNFMLGVEYAAAIAKYAPHIALAPVRRVGGYNDTQIPDGITGPACIAGATAIRNALTRGAAPDAARAVPAFVDLGVRFAALRGLESTLLYQLRTLPQNELLGIMGMDEGLHHVFAQKAARTETLDCLLNAVKTKRYTLARLKRALCCLLLGITKEIAAAANEGPPPYLRLLGFRKSAEPLLGRISKALLITQKSDAAKLSAAARQLYQIDCVASDIQALSGNADIRAKRDFTERLIVL